MDKDKTHDNDDNKQNENPLDELKKQLEGLFGGKPVHVDFVPPPFGAMHEPQQEESQNVEDDSDEVLKRIREFSMKPREKACVRLSRLTGFPMTARWEKKLGTAL
jgi:hypothetical protein